jgi:3-oxoacyl-[acyl-carrier protein] reductase
MPVSLSLEGKVALVSGGSRGIGAAIVRMFANAGARVLFSYEKARPAAEALSHECGANQCVAAQCSLNSPRAAQNLVDTCIQRFGGIDILVANHGIWPDEDLPIDKMPDEHWRRTMSINLDAVFGLIKHSVTEMKKTAGPNSPSYIVLISSTSGQRGEAFHTDYSATKGAIISITKGLSTELAPHHIYVNCVAPGWVDTDMCHPTLDDPEKAKKIFATIPLGRVAKPEEIAGPVLFLCTPHAAFITGEVFNVNGGAVLVG